MPVAPFLFVCCQAGAEPVLKTEFARQWPQLRFAFSRPGFVTFKLPDDLDLAEDFELRSVFARTYGFSLGRVDGQEASQMASQVWQLTRDYAFDHLHVWQRDSAVPGDGGYEPGVTPLATEVAQAIAAARPVTVPQNVQPHADSDADQPQDRQQPLPINRRARPGQRILDCVLVEPNQWWVGMHRTASMPSRWPGGVCPVELPADAVSRAYLKMVEALEWSRLPLTRGDRCVEIGSSPGGSCQALLERGAQVLGIDPALMDPLLLEYPNFKHLRARASDLKRRQFRGIKWLMADSNVAPNYTLDAVEAIVTHRLVNVRGMLLTLKLLNWELAEQIPSYLDRIRSWGYHHVNARQLAYNRQEICVYALKRRSLRRNPPKYVKHEIRSTKHEGSSRPEAQNP